MLDCQDEYLPRADSLDEPRIALDNGRRRLVYRGGRADRELKANRAVVGLVVGCGVGQVKRVRQPGGRPQHEAGQADDTAGGL